MKPLLQVFTYMIITLTVIICQKNEDEGRAYEFGFTIDGQQHRHEKKDQNGIIQGEFGFITADGVYHVTVYATDENGNFKILSMRNIRISAPLDGSPATGPISPEAGKYLKKPNQMEQPKTPSTPLPQKFEKLQQLPLGPQVQNIITTQKPRAPYVFTTKPTIKPACGGCGYVTTAKPIPFPVKNTVSNNPVSSFPQGPSTNQNTQLPNKFGQSDIATQHQNQPPSNVELSAPVFPGDSLTPNIAVPHQSHQSTYQTTNQNLQLPSRFGQVDSATQNQNQPPSDVELLPPVYPGDSLTQNIPVPPQSQQSTYQSPQQGFQGSGQNPQRPSEFGQLLSGPTTGIQNDKLNPNAVQPNLQTHQDVQVYQNSVQPNFQSSGGYNQNQHSFVQNQDKQQPAQGHEDILTNIPGFGSITNSGQLDRLNGPASGFARPNIPPPISEVPKLPPVSVSDNVIHVGGKNPMDIPIKDKFPGMVDGLPNGVKETDVTGILYKFKFTVGFHGHYEKGLKNGTKIGGYFVNGRDGISRVVTYIADENGYRPKFKFINLGLDSPDTPKEDTEKTFGLKSFEFVWYPIE